MDPTETLVIALRNLRDANDYEAFLIRCEHLESARLAVIDRAERRSEAVCALVNLARWLRNGGYAPSVEEAAKRI